MHAFDGGGVRTFDDTLLRRIHEWYIQTHAITFLLWCAQRGDSKENSPRGIGVDLGSVHRTCKQF